MANYERVYDVGLLDDLHNYFPALLYQQNSFQTVPDVLAYIRDRITRRFNLYDYGRRQYESTIPVPLFPRPRDEVRVEFTNPVSLFPLFRSLSARRQGQTTYEDVIVHATQTIIDGASTEETLDEDLDIICTICQDRMRQGELIRKLTVCNHEFHRSCLDNWLLHRSVRCPTCRHDIREPAVSATTSLPTALPTTSLPSTALPTTSLPTTASDIDSMLPSDLIDLLFRRMPLT